MKSPSSRLVQLPRLGGWVNVWLVNIAMTCVPEAMVSTFTNFNRFARDFAGRE